MTKIRNLLIIISLLLSAACANHEGLYEPACIAYEGNRVELQDGRFEWRRFTDQRVVGDDGKAVDPFPGFPKSGSYRLSAGRMEFASDDGMELGDWYLVDHMRRPYLLNGEQYDAFRQSNKMPECALTRRDSGS